METLIFLCMGGFIEAFVDSNFSDQEQEHF